MRKGRPTMTKRSMDIAVFGFMITVAIAFAGLA